MRGDREVHTPSDSDRLPGRPERWSLRLLGGFELRTLPGGETLSLSGKRERALLAYLALSPNCRQPRRKLMTLLWGDGADETTLDNLRTCMWRLRKALDDADHRLISSQDDNVVLDVSAFDVDVIGFRQLATQSGSCELEAATSLYAGEFLDGLEIESEEFQSWCRAEATRYRDQAIEALTRLMTLFSDNAQIERASETGLQILRLEPLHEEATRRVMRLYSQTGRRGAAIQLYRSLAATLRAELDTEPEVETRLLFAAIARGGQDRPDRSITAPSRASNGARPSDVSVQPLGKATKALFRSRASAATIAAALIAGLALLSYPQLAQLGARQASVADPTASTLPARAISIAVLPFNNLSGDLSQEFFSDGVTEEVTSALARVPNLSVVARTSAFEFKGQNRDVRGIAQSLGATHVLEGSVRKEADRVRITAQLVKAEEGTQIWSESYDRQLTDIFAIQEDIARAIATSLRVPLGLNLTRNLVYNRNVDLDSYEKLLRAKALYDGRLGLQSPGGLQNYVQAESLVNEVVAKNPDFPPARALLGAIYFQVANTHAANANEPIAEARARVNEFREKGEAAARQALQADPSLTGAYAVLTVLTWSRGKPVEAEELYLKALALDPTDFYLLDGYAIRLGAAGRIKEALALLERARAVEPFQPAILLRYAEDLWLNGQNDEAIALAKTLRPSDRATTLARIYASMGRYAEAADALTELASNPDSAPARAARLLRAAPAKTENPDSLPPLPGGYDYVYLHVGAPERAIATYERRAEIGYLAGNPTAHVWHPSYAPARKTQRFKTLMRKVGLVDYWRAKGWPDLCRPVGADDFVCD
jgi:TolB-like protein/DNA-binding SARP family transcriptional activator/Flp pilus assembly protein TadD